MLKKLSLYSGIIIPVWLFIGVAIAGTMNPGYSHIEQAMSELGARGSATHFLSPVINNFPLGILFITFGLHLISVFKSRLAIASGVMVVIHGIGSISAGYFSCDISCQPESPSNSQVMHNLSGLIMFVSLTIAGWLWVYLGKRQLGSTPFSWFTLVCMTIALGAALMLPHAVESGHYFGLYQRINYGAFVVWLAGLSYMLSQCHENVQNSAPPSVG
ncbi:MAG TPA: DUF998 domain-containing protein [Cellvibrio sp.]|nr:DUF998 domain-containing protein [Cellvibrio sp.]